MRRKDTIDKFELIYGLYVSQAQMRMLVLDQDLVIKKLSGWAFAEVGPRTFRLLSQSPTN